MFSSMFKRGITGKENSSFAEKQASTRLTRPREVHEEGRAVLSRFSSPFRSKRQKRNTVDDDVPREAAHHDPPRLHRAIKCSTEPGMLEFRTGERVYVRFSPAGQLWEGFTDAVPAHIGGWFDAAAVSAPEGWLKMNVAPTPPPRANKPRLVPSGDVSEGKANLEEVTESSNGYLDPIALIPRHCSLPASTAQANTSAAKINGDDGLKKGPMVNGTIRGARAQSKSTATGANITDVGKTAPGSDPYAYQDEIYCSSAGTEARSPTSAGAPDAPNNASAEATKDFVTTPVASPTRPTTAQALPNYDATTPPSLPKPRTPTSSVKGIPSAPLSIRIDDKAMKSSWLLINSPRNVVKWWVENLASSGPIGGFIVRAPQSRRNCLALCVKEQRGKVKNYLIRCGSSEFRLDDCSAPTLTELIEKLSSHDNGSTVTVPLLPGFFLNKKVSKRRNAPSAAKTSASLAKGFKEGTTSASTSTAEVFAAASAKFSPKNDSGSSLLRTKSSRPGLKIKHSQSPTKKHANISIRTSPRLNARKASLRTRAIAQNTRSSPLRGAAAQSPLARLSRVITAPSTNFSPERAEDGAQHTCPAFKSETGLSEHSEGTSVDPVYDEIASEYVDGPTTSSVVAHTMVANTADADFFDTKCDTTKPSDPDYAVLLGPHARSSAKEDPLYDIPQDHLATSPAAEISLARTTENCERIIPHGEYASIAEQSNSDVEDFDELDELEELDDLYQSFRAERLKSVAAAAAVTASHFSPATAAAAKMVRRLTRDSDDIESIMSSMDSRCSSPGLIVTATAPAGTSSFALACSIAEASNVTGSPNAAGPATSTDEGSSDMKTTGVQRRDPPAPVYIAAHEFHPENEDELRLSPGDEIAVIEQLDGGWWHGRCGDAIGWFPANHCNAARPAARVLSAMGSPGWATASPPPPPKEALLQSLGMGVTLSDKKLGSSTTDAVVEYPPPPPEAFA